MRLADRARGLMDGTRGKGADEGKKQQFFSGRVESQAWLQHTALPVFTPSTTPWISARLHGWPVSLRRSLHPLTFWLSLSLFPLSPPSFLSPPPLLLLALIHFAVFLPPLSLLAFSPSSIFRWRGRVAGPDQSLGVSIAILCVRMSLVLTMCS